MSASCKALTADEILANSPPKASPIISVPLMKLESETLTTEQIAQFNELGWLITQTLGDSQIAELQSWVQEIQDLPDSGPWLHYREQTEYGPKLCRTEYFTPSHHGFRQFLTQGAMVNTASSLLGEPAVLYKEKINYKLVGGAGYSPHQDAPAYRFVEIHLSCMVAVDDATIENGCLEVASGMHNEILPMDEEGCISPHIVSAMQWFPVELKAGQTLWFHSRTPHRSGDNNSNRDRRALYPTYNALSEGDLRELYYAQKLQEFQDSKNSGERVRVSLINDFRGRHVSNDQ